ncbi:hypothetical protein FQA39_LY15221 [Lamprigera yunnana]|nr:hypothetical protein FQA39_LY15221 [Lamprigera yunnana]
MTKFLTQRWLELAIEEAVREMHNENEQIDAVYISPEVDHLIDEEDFSEDPENNKNSQNGDIVVTFEIHTGQDDCYDESDNKNLVIKRRKILQTKSEKPT